MGQDLRVNYDELAATYNRRYQVDPTQGVAETLLELMQRRKTKRALEAGCGTGRWLEELAQSRNALEGVFGIDPSRGMLEQACLRPGEFSLVQGQAERLPFPTGSFDLVYCVNALHHFSSARFFILEARRVLQSNGGLAVIHMTPQLERNRWFVYQYFHGTLQTDLERFPTWGTILDWMLEAGFTNLEWRPAAHIYSRKVGKEILADVFIEKASCSQLALLTPEAYAEGINTIKKAIVQAESNGQTLVFETDILLDMLVGTL